MVGKYRQTFNKRYFVLLQHKIKVDQRTRLIHAPRLLSPVLSVRFLQKGISGVACDGAPCGGGGSMESRATAHHVVLAACTPHSNLCVAFAPPIARNSWTL